MCVFQGGLITLEKVITSKNEVSYPLCIRGKRSTPPEDVGCVWGFENFKAIMSNPSNEEYQEWKEWYGGEFDAEKFSIKDINKLLKDYVDGKFKIEDDWGNE